MPYLSAFTPCGLLECTSEPSPAESLYYQMIASLGDQYCVDEGTHIEASIYARAMALGCTRRLLEHAGEQSDPLRTHEMLPLKESEYGIVPTPTGTLQERRRELAAHRLLLKGCTQANVEEAFSILLGSDFIAYRPTPIDELVTWPAALGDQPMNLQLPRIARRVITLFEPVLVTGSSVTVAVEQVSPIIPFVGEGAPPDFLFIGDKLVVEPGTIAQAEVVTIEQVGDTFINLKRYPTVTATFTKVHPAGAVAATGAFPLWASTKRFSLVVVSNSAAQDAEKRRKIHGLMRRIARGVSTWAIAGETASGMVGPFVLSESRLSVDVFGELSV